MLLRHLLEMIVNPFSLFVLALFFLLVFSFVKKSNLRWQLFSLFIFLLTISTGFLPQCLTTVLEKPYPYLSVLNQQISWIVVLSGGQAEKEDLPDYLQLYSASLKRVLTGIQLAMALPKSRLILSGGGYQQKKAEALRMYELVSWFPQVKNRVLLELQSVNTADQARLLKPYLKKHSFYLVTSAIHMKRAIALCQKQGLKALPAPSDFTGYWQDNYWQKTLIPSAQNIVYLSIALHEIMGIVWAKWRGES